MVDVDDTPPPSDMGRVAQWPDDEHLWAIRAAEQVHAKSPKHVEAIGLGMAYSVGARQGPLAAGVFAMAFRSALGALEIERDDRLSVFCEVADHWWADPAHQTSYDAPRTADVIR